MSTRVIDDWIISIQNLYTRRTCTWPMIVQGTGPVRDTEIFRRSEYNEIWFWYPETRVTSDYWDLIGLALDRTWADYQVSNSDMISRGLGLPGYECVPTVWIYRIERLQRLAIL